MFLIAYLNRPLPAGLTYSCVYHQWYKACRFIQSVFSDHSHSSFISFANRELLFEASPQSFSFFFRNSSIVPVLRSTSTDRNSELACDLTSLSR